MTEGSTISDYLSSTLEFFTVPSDERVAEWYLMGSSTNVLLISVAYVIISLYIGPLLMKNRKPFSLKKIITAYNIFQIVCCSIIANKILKEDLWYFNQDVCDPKIFNRMEAVELGYWTLFLKMFELIETIFFVMRKKQSQVTKLHLYHHSTTFLLVWVGIKYQAGLAMDSFILLNCIVHVVMYGYYLLTAVGNNKVKNAISPFKKYLTILQMVQFVLLLYITLVLILKKCSKTGILSLLFIPNVLVVFVLFYNFYKRAYTKKKAATGKKH